MNVPGLAVATAGSPITMQNRVVALVADNVWTNNRNSKVIMLKIDKILRQDRLLRATTELNRKAFEY